MVLLQVLLAFCLFAALSSLSRESENLFFDNHCGPQHRELLLSFITRRLSWTYLDVFQVLTVAVMWMVTRGLSVPSCL